MAMEEQPAAREEEQPAAREEEPPTNWGSWLLLSGVLVFLLLSSLLQN